MILLRRPFRCFRRPSSPTQLARRSAAGAGCRVLTFDTDCCARNFSHHRTEGQRHR